MRARGLLLVALITVAAGCSNDSVTTTGDSAPSSSADQPPVGNLTVTEVCTRASDLWELTDSLDVEDLRTVEEALLEISTEPTIADESFALIHLQFGLSDAIAFSVSDSRGAMRRALDRGFAEFERACRQDGARL